VCWICGSGISSNKIFDGFLEFLGIRMFCVLRFVGANLATMPEGAFYAQDVFALGDGELLKL
jgi:hypothetical protein